MHDVFFVCDIVYGAFFVTYMAHGVFSACNIVNPVFFVSNIVYDVVNGVFFNQI